MGNACINLTLQVEGTKCLITQGKEDLRDAPILQHLLILQTQQHRIQETIDIMDKNAIQRSGSMSG